jgi:hypothetical protein
MDLGWQVAFDEIGQEPDEVGAGVLVVSHAGRPKVLANARAGCPRNFEPKLRGAGRGSGA